MRKVSKSTFSALTAHLNAHPLIPLATDILCIYSDMIVSKIHFTASVDTVIISQSSRLKI